MVASNALLVYGFGSMAGQSQKGHRRLAFALALALTNATASAFLWGLHSFLLAPLGLESLDILFFTLVAVPILKFIGRASSLSGNKLVSQIGEMVDDLVIGSLVFGVALISSNSGFSLSEALAASAASGIGYWLATILLESIRERLELSDLPSSFKGAPSMLVSTGLMALAFMGLDAVFVAGLAG